MSFNYLFKGPHAGPHQRNIKVCITGPLWGEFTSNAEKASMWWRHNGRVHIILDIVYTDLLMQTEYWKRSKVSISIYGAYMHANVRTIWVHTHAAYIHLVNALNRPPGLESNPSELDCKRRNNFRNILYKEQHEDLFYTGMTICCNSWRSGTDGF